MNEERDPFEDADELRFASQDQIGEWEEEVKRWLPEAVGHSVYDSLLTDEADLVHLMDWESTGERDERGEELHWATAGSWEEARAALLRYGVDIGPREGSQRSDTNLVSLAKRTLGRPRAAGP